MLLLATIALPGQLLQGQNGRRSLEQDKRMHNESISDPYLPNAWNNQKTSPAYRYKSRIKSTPQASSVFTVQVNVDASGRNISGDAGNEPSIALNPLHPEQIVIGWRQFDNVGSNFRQAGWSYTTDAGQSWTFPGVIEPGIFRSDPVLDYDALGNIYYNSLTNSPGYFCKVFKSNTGGKVWDGGIDAHGGDKQWMVIDRSEEESRGNIYSTWSYYFSTCEPGFFTRSADDGNHYEDCVTVDGSPYWCTMAVGNAGELYIAGQSGSMDSLVVSKSTTARDGSSEVTWNTPVLVYFDGNPGGWRPINPEGLLGQVSIDVDHSDGPGRDNVYVLAPIIRTSNGDPCDVMFARSTDGGLTWSNPIRVNDDDSRTNYQWFGTMSVAPTGRIDAIWLDTRDAPAGSDSSALYYSFSSDQGLTWSVNEKVSASFDPHLGYPNQNKMGDYFDMLSDSTGAHVAWANTFNGEQDVYYSHIVPYSSTGMQVNSSLANITTFPNPVTGTLIVSGLAGDSRVEVYTVLGERVYSNNCQYTACEIDLSEQSAGIYFLKIVDAKGSALVRKIVRE